MAGPARGLRLFLLLVAATPAALRADDAAASQVEVRFLDRKGAAAAIVDESMEPYFSLLQPLEMIAKTGSPLAAKDLPAQRDECRKRYQEGVLEFTDAEKSAIGDAARAVSAALKDAYPLFASTPWSFLKLDDAFEGGMPHTRGPHIVFSPSVAAMFAGARAGGADPAHSVLGEVLVHEQCHVVERAHPKLFADLFVNVWGFVRAEGLESCPQLTKVQLKNPDGVDVGWVFPEKEGGSTVYWQPLVVLRDGVERPRMPRDFVTIGVRCVKKGRAFHPEMSKEATPVTMPLDEINAYHAAFGHVDENFHPNETFAVLFSWLAMKDHVGAAGPGLDDHSSVDFTKLREWCKKHFAAAPPGK